jgi:hypothetical protein
MTQKRSNPIFRGKRGIFLGGILLVVAVIAFVSLDGYPPADGDTVGAIGAAKRYRSDQMTSADVKLEDKEIQALLQSDVFQKMIRSEEFQESVKNGTYAAASRGWVFEALAPILGDAKGAASRYSMPAGAAALPAMDVDAMTRTLKVYEAVSRAPKNFDARSLPQIDVEAMRRQLKEYDARARELQNFDARALPPIDVDAMRRAIEVYDAVSRTPKAFDAKALPSVDVEAMRRQIRVYDAVHRLSTHDVAAMPAMDLEAMRRALEVYDAVSRTPKAFDARALPQIDAEAMRRQLAVMDARSRSTRKADALPELDLEAMRQALKVYDAVSRSPKNFDASSLPALDVEAVRRQLQVFDAVSRIKALDAVSRPTMNMEAASRRIVAMNALAPMRQEAMDSKAQHAGPKWPLELDAAAAMYDRLDVDAVSRIRNFEAAVRKQYEIDADGAQEFAVAVRQRLDTPGALGEYEALANKYLQKADIDAMGEFAANVRTGRGDMEANQDHAAAARELVNLNALQMVREFDAAVRMLSDMEAMRNYTQVLEFASDNQLAAPAMQLVTDASFMRRQIDQVESAEIGQ